MKLNEVEKWGFKMKLNEVLKNEVLKMKFLKWGFKNEVKQSLKK